MNNLYEHVFFKTCRIVAGVGMTGILCIQTLPHIYPLKFTLATGGSMPCNLQGIYQRHKKILEETCQQMNINSENVMLVYSNGFFTKSCGSTFLPNKSVIALSKASTLLDVGDFNSIEVKINNMDIDWNTGIGTKLAEALLMKDEHVKFLIAHELTHIKKHHFVSGTLFSIGMFYGFYKAGMYIPTLLTGRPFLNKVLLSCLIWTFGAVTYKTSRCLLNYDFEYMADETAARSGLSYCNGGIGYMRAQMKQNRILRVLNGEIEGPKLFSQIGNNLADVYTHPKRSERLKRLKEFRKANYPEAANIDPVVPDA